MLLTLTDGAAIKVTTLTCARLAAHTQSHGMAASTFGEVQARVTESGSFTRLFHSTNRQRLTTSYLSRPSGRLLLCRVLHLARFSCLDCILAVWWREFPTTERANPLSNAQNTTLSARWLATLTFDFDQSILCISPDTPKSHCKTKWDGFLCRAVMASPQSLHKSYCASP